MAEGDTAAGRPAAVALEVEGRHGAFLLEPTVAAVSDGSRLLCQCGDKVNVLVADTGEVERVLETQEDTVSALTLSPDDTTLVSSHSSGLLRQWDWRTGQLARVWKSLHAGPVVTLRFDSSSTLVASGGVDGSIKVWDIIRQYCTHSLKGSAGVISVIAFHQLTSSEIHLYAAGDDSLIRCWSLTTSNVVQELEGHFSKVTGLEICAKTNQLVSCGRDKVVMLWNMSDGSLVRTVATHESLEGVLLLPDGVPLPGTSDVTAGLHVLTAGERGVLRVWDLTTSRCVHTQADPVGAPVVQLCSSNGTQRVTVVTSELNLLTYQLPSLQLTQQLVGFSDEILDVVYCGSDQTHIAVATNSPVIKLYHVATFHCRLVKGHKDTVLALAGCPSQPSLFVSGSKDNTVRLWAVTGGPGQTRDVTCLAVGAGHTASVGAVCCSQLSAQFLLSGGEDKCVKLWRTPEFVAGWLKEPRGPGGPAELPASLHCHRTEIAHQKDINCVAVSPNDKLLATASQDGTARLYRCEPLTSVGVFRGHRRGVWCVTFSPVDQVVATASADCSVRLWAVSDLSCLKTFEGHDSSVLRVAFLDRGTQLLTCSADGLLKLWSVRSNECVHTHSEHEGKVWALAVRSDQRQVVSGGADSTLLVWRDVSEAAAAQAAQAAALRASQEQALSNLVHTGQWLPALRLALRLNRPFRCLQVLKQLRTGGAERQLGETLSQLRDDQLDTLLQFCAEWNTNSKHCQEAQRVVSLLMRCRTPDQWRRLPGHRGLLESLLPYTQRHMDRLDRLLQGVAFLDYTSACMKLSAPASDQQAYPDEQLFVDDVKPEAAQGGEREVEQGSDTEPVPSSPGTGGEEGSDKDPVPASPGAPDRDVSETGPDPASPGAPAGGERDSSADSGLEVEAPTAPARTPRKRTKQNTPVRSKKSAKKKKV